MSTPFLKSLLEDIQPQDEFEVTIPMTNNGGDGEDYPIEDVEVIQDVPEDAQQENASSGFSNFITFLFAARDKAHELHLATDSFSEHSALNDLYELLLEYADRMAEVYQGMSTQKVGKFAGECVEFAGDHDAKSFLEVLVNNLISYGENTEELGEDKPEYSALVNIFQELLGEVYRQKYKIDSLS